MSQCAGQGNCRQPASAATSTRCWRAARSTAVIGPPGNCSPGLGTGTTCQTRRCCCGRARAGCPCTTCSVSTGWRPGADPLSRTRERRRRPWRAWGLKPWMTSTARCKPIAGEPVASYDGPPTGYSNKKAKTKKRPRFAEADRHGASTAVLAATPVIRTWFATPMSICNHKARLTEPTHGRRPLPGRHRKKPFDTVGRMQVGGPRDPVVRRPGMPTRGSAIATAIRMPLVGCPSTKPVVVQLGANLARRTQSGAVAEAQLKPLAMTKGGRK